LEKLTEFLSNNQTEFELRSLKAEERNVQSAHFDHCMADGAVPIFKTSERRKGRSVSEERHCRLQRILSAGSTFSEQWPTFA